jgi:hypothetical protein
MDIELYDLITKSAKKGLILQNKDGSFPKGTNGPWKDNDTYIRTTAHWSLLMYKAYEVTNNVQFYKSAIKACDYLALKKSRPYGFSFYCRESTKDKCNGLIGQAWALESLIRIGKKTNINSYIKLSEDVILKHEYNKSMHLWRNLEIDGVVKKYNLTINQQLWFSIMALILGDILKSNKLIEVATDFFMFFPKNITYIKNNHGLIQHIIDAPDSFRKRIKKILFKRKTLNEKKEIEARSLGYLSFILQGFALAYDFCPTYDFWSNQSIKGIIKDTYTYIEKKYPYGYLESDSSFRWSYNPIGIEIAYFTQIFKDYIGIQDYQEKLGKWLSLQIKGHYNFKSNLMNKNTIDPNILSSRLYEAVNIENCFIRHI